jgi:hypothetical protein
VNVTIEQADFTRMFRLENSGIPDLADDLIRKFDLSYQRANKEELEEYVLTFIKLIEKEEMVRTREENLHAFENGWTENLEELKTSSPASYESALKPKYYRGSKFFRYNDDLVITENLQLEYELSLIARFCLFQTYLEKAETICEIGCGSCLNLSLLSKVLPKAKLIGLDWTSASCEIARELGEQLSRPISGVLFDMLGPDFLFEIPTGAAIISIHAFEQLGNRFEPILEYLIRSKPSIVVQYEPVFEFYNGNNLLDYLALSYCRRRSYLEGYYSRLQQLEKNGQIKIVNAFRPYLGGVLHESSVLVWKPT